MLRPARHRPNFPNRRSRSRPSPSRPSPTSRRTRPSPTWATSPMSPTGTKRQGRPRHRSGPGHRPRHPSRAGLPRPRVTFRSCRPRGSRRPSPAAFRHSSTIRTPGPPAPGPSCRLPPRARMQRRRMSWTSSRSNPLARWRPRIPGGAAGSRSDGSSWRSSPGCCSPGPWRWVPCTPTTSSTPTRSCRASRLVPWTCPDSIAPRPVTVSRRSTRRSVRGASSSSSATPPR